MCSCKTPKKNQQIENQVLIWNLIKLLLPEYGGRVEIGLPCITSEKGGPLTYQTNILSSV